MGANLSAPAGRGDDPFTPTLVTLSEKVVTRLDTGTLGPSVSPAELRDTSDDEYNRKLDCIDENHARQLGLLNSQFEELIGNLERSGMKHKQSVPCHEKFITLTHCYKQHDGCRMECWKELEDLACCVAGEQSLLMDLRMKREAAKKQQEEVRQVMKSEKLNCAKYTIGQK